MRRVRADSAEGGYALRRGIWRFTLAAAVRAAAAMRGIKRGGRVMCVTVIWREQEAEADVAQVTGVDSGARGVEPGGGLAPLLGQQEQLQRRRGGSCSGAAAECTEVSGGEGLEGVNVLSHSSAVLRAVLELVPHKLGCPQPLAGQTEAGGFESLLLWS